jgi:hypothetical protein
LQHIQHACLVIFIRERTLDQSQFDTYPKLPRPSVGGLPIKFLAAYGRQEVLEGRCQRVWQSPTSVSSLRRVLSRFDRASQTARIDAPPRPQFHRRATLEGVREIGSGRSAIDGFEWVFADLPNFVRAS